MNDDETLRRFVLRARRIQAHSLVQHWDELLRHASGEFKAQLDISGRMTITRLLPENEEVFESLASRIRPLTVASEPVYYAQVFDALERALGVVDADEGQRNRVRDLRRAWEAAEIQGTQTQAYAVQSARMDGTEATNLVSDTQLAAAWLYADLVHADARGPKEEALAFSLGERYAAAVRVFSHMAVLTVATLRLVESLSDAGALAVEDAAWEKDVVVGTSEFVREARAFVAPLGSAVPDMRSSLELPEEWSEFTVTEFLRQDPVNHVRVVLRSEVNETIASYDAAVSRRHPADTSAQWDVLVAGSVMFRFSFDLHGEQLTQAHLLGWEAFDSTNELKLASTRLQLQMDRAKTMAFEVHGQQLLTLGPPTIPDAEHLELEVIAQTVEDVVAIQGFTGKNFDPCNGHFDDRDRVRLRRARLLWEGQIVNAMRHPVTTTAPEGRAPQVIVDMGKTINVGGAKVLTPQTCLRHPGMTATETGADPAAGPDAKTYRMEAPNGEQFVAWSPERVSVANDEALVATASWNLIGIDEATFPY